MYTAADPFRRAIEMTYNDTCDIYFSKTIHNNLSQQIRYKAHTAVKCALSQKNVRPSNQTETTNEIRREDKLFIAPEPQIPAGSEIKVYHNGRVTWFKNTGEAFPYPTHQELILSRIDKA